jgi:hypothetical protein
MFRRNTSPKFIALKRQRNKIRNSNIEIRNKPKDSNPNYGRHRPRAAARQDGFDSETIVLPDDLFRRHL